MKKNISVQMGRDNKKIGVAASSIDVFDEVYDFKNGLAKVRRGIFYGVINIEGKVIVPVKYDEVKILENGVIEVKCDEKYGIVTTHNENGVMVEDSPVKLQLLFDNFEDALAAKEDKVPLKK